MTDKYEILAKLGIEAVSFQHSDLGRYLNAKAEKQVQAAQEEFKDCDINNTVLVESIQKRINIPIQAMAWFYEIIQDGRDAEGMLQDEINQEIDEE